MAVRVGWTDYGRIGAAAGSEEAEVSWIRVGIVTASSTTPATASRRFISEVLLPDDVARIGIDRI
jgi:hypothetical protein